MPLIWVGFSPGWVFPGPSERNSYWEGVPKRGESEATKNGGQSGGLPPGKFSMTMPFRSLENAKFLELAF